MASELTETLLTLDKTYNCAANSFLLVIMIMPIAQVSSEYIALYVCFKIRVGVLSAIYCRVDSHNILGQDARSHMVCSCRPAKHFSPQLPRSILASAGVEVLPPNARLQQRHV